MEKFNELVTALENIKAEAEKFYTKENASAGTRLRKGLKVVSDLSKQLRKDVSSVKKDRKGATA